jgi:hypothetical protein
VVLTLRPCREADTLASSGDGVALARTGACERERVGVRSWSVRIAECSGSKGSLKRSGAIARKVGQGPCRYVIRVWLRVDSLRSDVVAPYLSGPPTFSLRSLSRFHLFSLLPVFCLTRPWVGY